MRKDKKSYRILVIEDNSGDYFIVEEFLKYQISDPVNVHATNFKQASGILSGKENSFDVILLDLTFAG